MPHGTSRPVASTRGAVAAVADSPGAGTGAGPPTGSAPHAATPSSAAAAARARQARARIGSKGTKRRYRARAVADSWPVPSRPPNSIPRASLPSSVSPATAMSTGTTVAVKANG
jgi:hypothetical protein